MYGVDFAAVGELRPQDARNNHIATKSRHEVFMLAIRLPSNEIDIIAVHVWAENPGAVKNNYFFDKHATQWIINRVKKEYPQCATSSVTKCVDGCAGQYKSCFAACGLELLRQHCELLSIDLVYAG